jgi:predicted O-linked N-acetylglucosamine transferase (SPINDLY family)
LAEKIRELGMDALVDLGGHTANNRIGVFGLSPAPVQATWLGYPNTTGMRRMAFRLADSLVDLPENDKFWTERLVRLRGPAWCYQLPQDLPPVSPSATGIVFGSLNNSRKYSRETVALWAKVLLAVPGAQLLLKEPGHPNIAPLLREDFWRRFEALGVPRERVRFLPRQKESGDFLCRYNEIDVALDTFPYNGTTTTMEAMAMGVPTVALWGDCHAARVSAALNQWAGLEALNANSEEEYVGIAVGLAEDKNRLLDLKKSLRERLLASPLCDGKAFAEDWTRTLLSLK